MNNILSQLHNVAPNSLCVNFLIARIQNHNYRQVHISQHNRYTQYEVDVILREIYNLVQFEPMQIRTTDLSKRQHIIAGEETYEQLTNNINAKLCRCTQDSLRKNFFVDFHRMNFLYRYNINMQQIPPFQKAHIKYISLTQTAENFLNANSPQKEQIYTIALMSLSIDFFGDLYEVVSDLDYITQNELMLFGTFLNQTFDGTNFCRINEIIELIKDFRTLNPEQQSEIIAHIRNYCNPVNFGETKTDMRDYDNWLNQTQQIWLHLQSIPKFIVKDDILRTI